MWTSCKKCRSISGYREFLTYHLCQFTLGRHQFTHAPMGYSIGFLTAENNRDIRIIKQQTRWYNCGYHRVICRDNVIRHVTMISKFQTLIKRERERDKQRENFMEHLGLVGFISPQFVVPSTCLCWSSNLSFNCRGQIDIYHKPNRVSCLLKHPIYVYHVDVPPFFNENM